MGTRRGKKDEIVAYAATEDTARNYFMNGDEYDWDAIEEWCEVEDPWIVEEELRFLANEMCKMSLEDINTFLYRARRVRYQGADWGNEYSGQVQLLTGLYEKTAKEWSDISGDNSYYTRALCCDEVVTLVSLRGKYYEDFTEIKPDETGNGEYTAYFLNRRTGENDYIRTYPAKAPKTLKYLLDNSIKNFVSPDFRDNVSSLLDTWIQTLILKPGFGLVAAVVDEYRSYQKSVAEFGDIEELIDLQSAVLMYDVTGYLITESIDGEEYADIIAESFDECTINAAAIYYNSMYGTNITAQDIKDSYSATDVEGTNIRNNYVKIFVGGNGEENINDICSTLSTIASFDHDPSFDSENITDERMDEAAENYRFMEEKFEQFCIEYNIDAENIVALTDDQLKELYYYTFG